MKKKKKIFDNPFPIQWAIQWLLSLRSGDVKACHSTEVRLIL